MKNISIGNKLIGLVALSAVIGIVIALVVFSLRLGEIKEDVYAESVEHITANIKQRIVAKEEICLSNAVSIGNDGAIMNSLLENNREIAIEAMAGLSAKFKSNTPFKNIKVHIHNKDGKSFLRSWKPSKFGDPLLDLRKTINDVYTNKKAVVGAEAGRLNTDLVGVAPIIDNNGSYLGSVEFKAGFNSIILSMEKEDHTYMLMLLKKETVKASFDSDEFKKLKQVNGMILNQKSFNEKFIKYANTINFDKLKSDKFIIDDQYFTTFTPVIDYSGKEIGYYIAAQDADHVEEIVVHSQEIIYTAITLMIIVLVVISLIIMVFSKQIIIKPLRDLNNAGE